MIRLQPIEQVIYLFISNNLLFVLTIELSIIVYVKLYFSLKIANKLLFVLMENLGYLKMYLEMGFLKRTF